MTTPQGGSRDAGPLLGFEEPSAEEQEANAQLIAAAPQLLEALERVTELAGDAYANDAESARVLLDASADIARAAIEETSRG